jgi:hypothetical protein
MQTLPLQVGVGFPSARSSIGSAVKVVSTSRSRVIFVSVFTGCPFFHQREKFGSASLVQRASLRGNELKQESFSENVAGVEKVQI